MCEKWYNEREKMIIVLLYAMISKKMPSSIKTIAKTFLCLIIQIQYTFVSKPQESSKTVHCTLFIFLFTEFFFLIIDCQQIIPTTKTRPHQAWAMEHNISQQLFNIQGWYHNFQYLLCNRLGSKPMCNWCSFILTLYSFQNRPKPPWIINQRTKI
jgi:hypothetical protein